MQPIINASSHGRIFLQMMTGLNELNDKEDELKQKEDEVAELRDKLVATSQMSQVGCL
jgi:hypothetical protein